MTTIFVENYPSMKINVGNVVGTIDITNTNSVYFQYITEFSCMSLSPPITKPLKALILKAFGGFSYWAIGYL
jgi:hypothetical protein